MAAQMRRNNANKSGNEGGVENRNDDIESNMEVGKWMKKEEEKKIMQGGP